MSHRQNSFNGGYKGSTWGTTIGVINKGKTRSLVYRVINRDVLYWGYLGILEMKMETTI